jgi:hypothetical protein
MRKWVTFGFVIALILLPLLFIHPRNSIEYHLREYRKAERKLTAQETLLDEMVDTLRKIRSKGLGGQGRLRSRMREHKTALIRLGYLEEQKFVVTNGLPSEFAAAVQKAVSKKGTNWEFFSAATYTNANAVRVIAVKSQMPTYEEILREMPSTTATKE